MNVKFLLFSKVKPGMEFVSTSIDHWKNQERLQAAEGEIPIFAENRGGKVWKKVRIRLSPGS